VIGEYTLASATGVVLTVLLELLVLRTGLFRDPRYWVALGIVAPFQLLGPRIACAPIEDLGFGFAMVTTTIALWRHTAPHPGGS
jgi:hypothetical protein